MSLYHRYATWSMGHSIGSEDGGKLDKLDSSLWIQTPLHMQTCKLAVSLHCQASSTSQCCLHKRWLAGAWLDIQDFFPSLDRKGVLDALRAGHHSVSKAQGRHVVNKRQQEGSAPTALTSVAFSRRGSLFHAPSVTCGHVCGPTEPRWTARTGSGWLIGPIHLFHRGQTAHVRGIPGLRGVGPCSGHQEREDEPRREAHDLRLWTLRWP